MNKIFSLVLAMVLVFSFTACGKKETSSDSNSVDIEYFAKLGQIPECEFAIGDSIAEIKEHYSTEEEEEAEHSDHSHDLYEIVEGEKSVLIDCGTQGYYYLKDKESNGVSYIVSYEDAYGFKLGDLLPDIKNAIEKYDFSEETANEENAFFLFSTGGSVLKCSFGNYTLMFAFENDALCATALYLTEDWKN